ncbi:MAG TPA: hypothetical protein PLI57_08300, partial [Spirochaetota bacterium]|nr:hypothetical protein [Spirochaetota bacterium]
LHVAPYASNFPSGRDACSSICVNLFVGEARRRTAPYVSIYSSGSDAAYVAPYVSIFVGTRGALHVAPYASNFLLIPYVSFYLPAPKNRRGEAQIIIEKRCVL